VRSNIFQINSVSQSALNSINSTNQSIDSSTNQSIRLLSPPGDDEKKAILKKEKPLYASPFPFAIHKLALNLYQSISIYQYQSNINLSPLPAPLPKLDHLTRAAAAPAQKSTLRKTAKIGKPNSLDKDLARTSLAITVSSWNYSFEIIKTP